MGPCYLRRTPELRQTKTTQELYRQHESNQTIAKIGYLVKVFTNTTTVTRIESQPAPASEKRKETVKTWYVSRHYDPRTEVWRGGTPKVLKL